MMYTISTAGFVSILTLASSLVVVVQAGDPRVVCIHSHSIPTTWTCDKLVAAVGTTEDQLLLMNPGQDCDQIIASGKVCTYASIRTCKTKVTAGSTDTKCDGLAAANGINKAQFIDYNDDVDAQDCSGVIPGQKYCVAIKDD